MSSQKKRMLVYCSQWANCRWKGYRTVEKLGTQTKPCPRCGKATLA